MYSVFFYFLLQQCHRFNYAEARHSLFAVWATIQASSSSYIKDDAYSFGHRNAEIELIDRIEFSLAPPAPPPPGAKDSEYSDN